jgi:5-methylcytosine-specific restriction protein A
MSSSGIPDGITRDDVLNAIEEFKSSVREHRFRNSTKYDLLSDGSRFPPKAILGIAARRVTGNVLTPDDFGGGEDTKCFRVLRELGFEIVPKLDAASLETSEWSDNELDAAVTAYLDMLSMELASNAYNKTEIRRFALAGALSGRSEPSFEYRMANISAVLSGMGRRWIEGYKPAKNVGTNVQRRIIESLRRLDALTPQDLEPDADPDKLFRKVRRARRVPPASPPRGNREPKTVTRNVVVYERDPQVIASVLDLSNGVCDLCDEPAPFKTSLNEPFLEVHHVVPLSEKGPDTTDNAVALCPNCHRECHYSRDTGAVQARLYVKISRLVRPIPRPDAPAQSGAPAGV